MEENLGKKTIYNLQQGEELNFGPYAVIRVPGGWIYITGPGGSAFVPYNNEFQGIADSAEPNAPRPLKIKVMFRQDDTGSTWWNVIGAAPLPGTLEDGQILDFLMEAH